MIPSSRQPINSHLFSRSTVGELPDEKGAGGRGEALKYIHICIATTGTSIKGTAQKGAQCLPRTAQNLEMEFGSGKGYGEM